MAPGLRIAPGLLLLRGAGIGPDSFTTLGVGGETGHQRPHLQEGAVGDLRGADEREAGTPLARGHPFGHRQARAIRKSAHQGPLPRGCARVVALDGQRVAIQWVPRIVDGDGA